MRDDHQHQHARQSEIAPPAGRPPLRPDDILKVREAAELLGLPVSTVYYYAKRGILPSGKIGTHVIFLRPQLEEWVWNRMADA